MLRMAKRKKNTFNQKVQKARKAAGLTQRQAAEKTGVALRTWISWENDPRPPSDLALRLLAKAFPENFKS